MTITVFPIPHVLPEHCQSPPRGKAQDSSPWTWAGHCCDLDKQDAAEIILRDFWGLSIKGSMPVTWGSLSRFLPLELGYYLGRNPQPSRQAVCRLFGLKAPAKVSTDSRHQPAGCKSWDKSHLQVFQMRPQIWWSCAQPSFWPTESRSIVNVCFIPLSFRKICHTDIAIKIQCE